MNNGRSVHVSDRLPSVPVDVPVKDSPSKLASLEKKATLFFEEHSWVPWALFFSIEVASVLWLSHKIQVGFELVARHIDLK